MSSSFLVGPIAPESNPPISPQYYLPIRFVITAISMGQTTIVTTEPPDIVELQGEEISSNYVIGQLVRLLIPQYWGAVELNGRQGYVLGFPASDQVQIQINSMGYTPFSAPTMTSRQRTTLPQIIPLGDVNSGVVNLGRTNNGTYIPGSFINVS